MYLIEIAFSIVTALATFGLINNYRFCAIKVSSGVTLFFCLLSSLIFDDGSIYFPTIFGASFIGMSLRSKFNPIEVSIAAVIFIPISFILAKTLPAVGGVLGLSAFVSLLVIFMTRKLFIRVFPLIN